MVTARRRNNKRTNRCKNKSNTDSERIIKYCSWGNFYVEIKESFNIIATVYILNKDKERIAVKHKGKVLYRKPKDIWYLTDVCMIEHLADGPKKKIRKRKRIK